MLIADEASLFKAQLNQSMAGKGVWRRSHQRFGEGDVVLVVAKVDAGGRLVQAQGPMRGGLASDLAGAGMGASKRKSLLDF